MKKLVVIILSLSIFSCVNNKIAKQKWVLAGYYEKGVYKTFSVSQDSCFIVEFDKGLRLRKFHDFSISGSANNTNSLYYSAFPLMGYYRVLKQNKIITAWHRDKGFIPADKKIYLASELYSIFSNDPKLLESDFVCNRDSLIIDKKARKIILLKFDK